MNSHPNRHATASEEASNPFWDPNRVRLCATPYIDGGLDVASRRLARCDFIKTLEKTGKSSLIDSFTRKGLPLGAHRACDPLHDPLLGFFLSIREMGLKETLTKWVPHMTSDLLTARSLPLPGTFLLKNESWIVRMYARGLVNFRSAVIVPGIGVLATEGLTRTQVAERIRGTHQKRDEIDWDLKLQNVHLEGAFASGVAAAVLYFIPAVGVATVVALGASALWSGGAAAAYAVKRHRDDITSAIVKGKQRLSQLPKRQEGPSSPSDTPASKQPTLAERPVHIEAPQGADLSLGPALPTQEPNLGFAAAMALFMALWAAPGNAREPDTDSSTSLLTPENSPRQTSS